MSVIWMKNILLILLALNTGHANANQHSKNTLCPDGFRHWSSSCYHIDSTTMKARDQAQKSCLKLDSRLVEITSLEEDEFIRSLALAENKTLNYWIGMEEKIKNYYWMDGSHLTFTYWDISGYGAHNDGSDCIRMEHFSQNHYWNDKSCAIEFWALCEGRETDPVCANVTTKFNSSCYYVSDDMFPRDQAKNYCEEGGAHLVYVETTDENSFIVNFVNVTTDSKVYWIGLTRRLAGSDRAAFGWMSGEPLVYSNFGDLNFGSGCLQIQTRDGYTKWNAVGCSQRRGYICERRDLSILQHQQRFILKQENSQPIPESVIDDVTTKTRIRCASRCVLNRDCASFGYNAQEMICILANSSIGTTFAADGFRHYVPY